LGYKTSVFRAQYLHGQCRRRGGGDMLEGKAFCPRRSGNVADYYLGPEAMEWGGGVQ